MTESIAVKNEALKTKYVAWLLDPEKTPSKQQDWAAAHNLTPETVSRWKHDEFVLGCSSVRTKCWSQPGPSHCRTSSASLMTASTA